MARPPMWCASIFDSRIAFLVLCALPLTGGPQDTVSGVVRSAAGPIAGATVRVQTTATRASTNARGEFVIPVGPYGKSIRLTASATGYYISQAVAAMPGSDHIEIRLWIRRDGIPGDG